MSDAFPVLLRLFVALSRLRSAPLRSTPLYSVSGINEFQRFAGTPEKSRGRSSFWEGKPQRFSRLETTIETTTGWKEEEGRPSEAGKGQARERERDRERGPSERVNRGFPVSAALIHFILCALKRRSINVEKSQRDSTREPRRMAGVASASRALVEGEALVTRRTEDRHDGAGTRKLKPFFRVCQPDGQWRDAVSTSTPAIPFSCNASVPPVS